METVPLAQLAAVRVAFERDIRKASWAAVLIVAALIVASISGPLREWIGVAVAKIGENARPESFDAVLLGVFTFARGLVRLLPLLAGALAAGAALLLALFWLGATSLTMAFAATERSYAVRGRNHLMIDFAQIVAGQLVSRKA